MNTQVKSTVAINTSSIAYRFGVEAAQRGEACVPEMVFLARRDQVNFAAGYESISGVNEVTTQFTDSVEPVAAKAHNWGDHNAKRAIAKVEAEQSRFERAYEATATFLGGIYEGDVLFLAA